MGKRAGRRNTGIKGGGRNSSGRHIGPPDQSFAGKRKVRVEKQELARRIAIATDKNWLTPVGLVFLRSLRENGPLAQPVLDKERAEAFRMLRAAKLVEFHGKAGGVPLYRLTAQGRTRLEEAERKDGA